MYNLHENMNLIFRIKSFLKFLYKAKPMAGYGIHSPFMFNFATKVLQTANKKKILLNEIKKLKRKLKSDNRSLNVIDYGTGSGKNSSTRKVSQIVRRSSTGPHYCRLLFNVALEAKPNTIIELGTSLGLSTTALSLAAPNSKIYTIEGSDEIARVAEENFRQLGLKNIIQYIGTFEENLDKILKKIQHPVMVFIDGNHSFEPTMKYFKTFAEIANYDSIIIIDDIHWSLQMESAWNEICNHPATTMKVDLFQMGIVFFKQGLPKMVYNILF
jgi:predicted O-methyltransferase YrrM